MPEELKAIEKLLGEIDEDLKALRSELAIERTSRRTTTVIMSVALVLLLLLFGWTLKLDYDDCQRTNEGRREIKVAFSLMVSELLGQNPSEDALNQAERFTDNLNRNLPEVECNWLPL